jgi:hypothetical protein
MTSCYTPPFHFPKILASEMRKYFDNKIKNISNRVVTIGEKITYLYNAYHNIWTRRKPYQLNPLEKSKTKGMLYASLCICMNVTLLLNIHIYKQLNKLN